MSRFRLFLGLLVVVAEAAVAHPLGNNTVNRQAVIAISPEETRVTYHLDLAEIPTLAEGIAADADRDGQTSDAEWDGWARRRAEDIRPLLDLKLGDQALALRVDGLAWHLAPGDAGLPILRMRIRYAASPAAPPMRVSFRYQDRYETARPGWKEICLSGLEGVVVTASNVPDRDRSRSLTDFGLPFGLSAPQELSASAELIFSAGTAGPGQDPLAGENSAGFPAASDGTFHAVRNGGWREAWAFFRLGMHHIAMGFDHLAFLFGLLLLSSRLGDVVKVVTAFTLAHSATLGLAAHGWVTAPGEVIEPAIALTIVYVGALGAWRRHLGHGVWLAFGFGLVHGFGFAGALSESLASRSDGGGNWLLNLASFNLGIETLQLLLVSLAFPLLRFSERFAWAHRAEIAASLSVMAAGLGWLILRLAGV
ncbi:HupE/UreJ family protein [Methylococcus geothermalis]|nr:HupE/UreJ family protein [Methylococcus geothermalis]